VVALLVAVTLAQAPVALVQTSNFGVPPKRVAELTHELGELLKLHGMTPIEVKGTCEDRVCLIASGKDVGADAVISLGFATVLKDTLVDMQALLVESDKTLKPVTFKIAPGASMPSLETTQFLVALKNILPPPPLELKAPPPTLTPPPSVELATPRAPPPSVPLISSRTPAFVASGAAIAAGISALILEALAIADKHTLDNQPPYSSLTETQGLALRNRSNGCFTGALVTSISAAALIALAIVLFNLSSP
jgi:hypothetical protein